MTKKFFGTDGIRGKVGVEPITPKTVVHLGWALGKVLYQKYGRGKVLIGKDTRISGYLLESAMESGLAAAGMDVVLLGPIPTPAIAQLTQSVRGQAGVVISASHNPFYDNGIKFFSSEGFKLDDDMQEQIEALMAEPMEMIDPEHMGKASRMVGAVGRYAEFCKGTIKSTTNFNNLKIALDCAHGAAYQSAPMVFRELGAELSIINASPDGFNINEQCGSTHIESLQKHVVENGCDLGVAFDGDADRLMMVDKNGKLVDGDQLLYVLAASAQEQGELNGGVVGTVMTNYGLERKFAEMNIDFIRSKVGDRYVMQDLKARGWSIGGESSGHIICLDKTSTGDGLIAALQVVEKLVERQKGLHEIVGEWDLYPQKMINVRLNTDGLSAQEICDHDAVKAAITLAEDRLADTGRVLLRPSGTEPLIRVMVEGQETELVNECCLLVSQAVESLC